MGNNPSCFQDAGDNAPVENVSWNDCQKFLKKLCRMEGVSEGTYRFLTEAGWEYACRAGTQTAFCYGDNLDATMANFDANYGYTTVNVGQFKPNAYGLYDTHGNGVLIGVVIIHPVK